MNERDLAVTITIAGIGTAGAIALLRYLHSRNGVKQDIKRLQKIISTGYLDKDERTVSIRGTNILIQNHQSYLPFEEMNKLDLNHARIMLAYWNMKRKEEWQEEMTRCLDTASDYDIQLMPISPFEFVLKNILKGVKRMPTLAEQNLAKRLIEEILTPFLDQSAITSWDLMNEPPHVSSNYETAYYNMLLDFLDYLKTLTNKPVTIGIDKIQQFEYLAKGCDMLSYHFYYHWWDIQHPYERLTQEISKLKTYSKPIIIQEFGFPTWYKSPSNQGNTPYQCPYITEPSPETEMLQRDYYANILHIIKEAQIEGYLFWILHQEPESQGGFSLIVKDRYLPASEVLP